MRHSVHSIFFDQADAHEAAERWHKALELLYQVQRWAPEDPSLWRRMGVLSFLTADRDWLERVGLEGTHHGDADELEETLVDRRSDERGFAGDEHGVVAASPDDGPEPASEVVDDPRGLLRALALDVEELGELRRLEGDEVEIDPLGRHAGSPLLDTKALRRRDPLRLRDEH
jgi:hypothetical protein